MLEHWLEHSDQVSMIAESLNEDRFGGGIMHHTAPFGSRQLILIGADPRWSKQVRRHLFRFSNRMQSVPYADLGNLRQTDAAFVTGLLMQTLESGMCPVLIGGHSGLIHAVQEAFVHTRLKPCPVFVDEDVQAAGICTDEIANIIGVQQHLLAARLPQTQRVLHLSAARQQMTVAEMMIRESSALLFNLAALGTSSLPAQKSLSTSGFTTEEACQLMRYAGLHSGTRMVLMYGHDPLSLHLDQSANTTAQLIWYFAEAFAQCIPEEDPLKHPDCTPYVVHFDGYNFDYIFLKSERTGRWWLQIAQNGKGPVYPCTYSDYQQAMEGVLSDRVLECTGRSLERSTQAL